jgi:hypothetical protein
MFDNLRNEGEATPFYEEEAKFQAAAGTHEPNLRPASRLFWNDAEQRFILAMLLLFATCSLGTMCMFITGRFGMP